LADLQTQTLLNCENEGCQQQFVDEIDDNLEGDAATLPSALKAHKAGWQLIDGKIYCPQCASGLKMPN